MIPLEHRSPDVATVAQLREFDEIIDVRSPSEFHEDHVPGAVNYPVLDDDERARIGTLYKQVSPFEAKKMGAALVSRNISRHLEQHLLDRPKSWKPMVYCWRGGKRSGAFTHILREIGWQACQLEGGYRAYRRAVIEELSHAPGLFTWRVICGPTGAGKSRLLHALDARGAQVLDLEAIACHRGSVLGYLPDEPQPSQKLFESMIWSQVSRFSQEQAVYVEAESKKIGRLTVPEGLIAAMWQSECVRLETSLEHRVTLLKDEYAHYLQDPQDLCRKLDYLTGLYGREAIAAWKQLALDRDWDRLVPELLERHYDPAYGRSTLKHFPRLGESPVFGVAHVGEGVFDDLAREVLDSFR